MSRVATVLHSLSAAALPAFSMQVHEVYFPFGSFLHGLTQQVEHFLLVHTRCLCLCFYNLLCNAGLILENILKVIACKLFRRFIGGYCLIIAQVKLISIFYIGPSVCNFNNFSVVLLFCPASHFT